MPKHLVIVESPAKARTIERYLGSDYQVLASYGHVRDLPENPGKGKFGVDVDHDFAPEYVIPDDRASRSPTIEKAARGADDVWLATDLDREGEAIAWHVAEAANVPAGEAPPGHLQRDHRGRDPRRVRRTARHRPGPRRRPADAPDRRPPGGLHAEPADLAQGARRPVGRPRAVGRGAAWSSSASARSARSPPASTGRSRRCSRRPTGDDVHRRRRRGSTARPSTSATARPPSGHATAIRGPAPGRRLGRDPQSKRNPSPPFTTSTLQQEASRKLGFSPKRTMSIAQDLYEGVDTPDGHVGLITYMRTDSIAIAGVAMAEAQEVITRALRRAVRRRQGPRLQDEGEGRPGGPRVDPADVVHPRPGLDARAPQGRRAPPLPADLAARDRVADGAQGARDHDRGAGRPARTGCAPRRRGRCSTASPGSTPRASTTPPRRPSARSAARRGRRHRGQSRSPRPSTSPSRRPATPRRP